MAIYNVAVSSLGSWSPPQGLPSSNVDWVAWEELGARSGLSLVEVLISILISQICEALIVDKAH